MQAAAAVIKTYTDFICLQQTQYAGKTFLCDILKGGGEKKKKNTSTALQPSFFTGHVGPHRYYAANRRGKITIEDFKKIIESKKYPGRLCSAGHGLSYPLLHTRKVLCLHHFRYNTDALIHLCRNSRQYFPSKYSSNAPPPVDT